MTKPSKKAALKEFTELLLKAGSPGCMLRVKNVEAAIAALPDDPVSREEMLGRVCYEVIAKESACTYSPWDQLQSRPAWIAAAAAAAVADKCKPREVTAEWVCKQVVQHLEFGEFADRINRYVRGEE